MRYNNIRGFVASKFHEYIIAVQQIFVETVLARICIIYACNEPWPCSVFIFTNLYDLYKNVFPSKYVYLSR